MLQRTLEPEIMDSDQEAQVYDAMDHSEVNRLFVDELLKFLGQDEWFAKRIQSADDEAYDLPELIDVLDVGTATAQIPVELCERSEEFRVMAIDLAVSMLDLALYNVESSSGGNRIELAKVDAKAMGYSDATFDVVISNSIIHHIPEPSVCLAEMVRVTRTGGALFVRDLMRPNDAATVDHLVQQYAGQESELSQKLFRASLHAALSLDEIKTLVTELGFSRESVVATSDRHWTWREFVEE